MRKGQFKSLEKYEAEAVRVGKCLEHSSSGAARRVYQMRHGKLPSHIFVCHKCDNPPCINDLHHFQGTNADNIRDSANKGRMRAAQNRPEVILKKRAALLGRKNGPHSEETRKKIGDSNRGKHLSPETRALISAARTGKKFGPHSAETNRRIGLGNKGKTVSQETRDLLSSINLGKKQSSETIAKRVAKNTGKKRTPEQLAVLKAALLAAHAAKRKAGTNKQTAEHIQHRLESIARNSAEKELLQSGYGHPWRIKDLDKATQEAVA